jgi:hypothetical protein
MLGLAVDTPAWVGQQIGVLDIAPEQLIFGAHNASAGLSRQGYNVLVIGHARASRLERAFLGIYHGIVDRLRAARTLQLYVPPPRFLAECDLSTKLCPAVHNDAISPRRDQPIEHFYVGRLWRGAKDVTEAVRINN